MSFLLNVLQTVNSTPSAHTSFSCSQPHSHALTPRTRVAQGAHCLCLSPKLSHLIAQCQITPKQGTCTPSLSSTLPSSHPLVSQLQPCADLRPHLSGALAEPPSFTQTRQNAHVRARSKLCLSKSSVKVWLDASSPSMVGGWVHVIDNRGRVRCACRACRACEAVGVISSVVGVCLGSVSFCSCCCRCCASCSSSRWCLSVHFFFHYSIFQFYSFFHLFHFAKFSFPIFSFYRLPHGTYFHFFHSSSFFSEAMRCRVAALAPLPCAFESHLWLRALFSQPPCQPSGWSDR